MNTKDTMKLMTLALLLTTGFAVAQEVEKKMEFKVVIAGEGDESSPMHWSSGDLGFDLQDLAVGETRTFDDESGKSVSVTRAENGFEFDVDGERIMLPHMGGHGSFTAFASEGGPQEDIDVQVIRGSAHAMHPHRPEGVTIISGAPLDDSVRDSIRSVLISAGNNEEVTFIDGAGGDQRVIVKKVEIVQ